jgi:hypothetical protein
MKLSYEDIENLAKEAMNGFMVPAISAKCVRPIPIDAFATRRLGLRLEYTRLSDDGQILGITTYTDTDIDLYRYCRKDVIRVSENTILIDEHLMKPLMLFDPDPERGRRQFTIGHECAHQMIYRMESDEQKQKLDLRYSARTASVALRNLESADDWREWQANAMASALLMPAKYIELLLGKRRLTLYGKRMNRPDKLLLENMCNRLGVSRSALTLRLRRLGYAKVLPASAFYDPTDIECDDDFDGAASNGIQRLLQCS